jgi:hypothetical protein
MKVIESVNANAIATLPRFKDEQALASLFMWSGVPHGPVAVCHFQNEDAILFRLFRM